MRIFEKIKDLGSSMVVLILIGVFFIVYSEIKRTERATEYQVISSDAVFYHEYIAVHLFGMQPYFPRTQNKVSKYTMGMAVTYIPGIAVGYLLSEINGVDHEYGKNKMYQRTLYYMGFLYTLIGLFFLRLILKKWFDDFLVAIVLSIVFFGTNLYYYVKVAPLMSHAASFCFIAAFIYYFLRLVDKKSIMTGILGGLSLGMITLIRPTNSVVFLFPLIFIIAEKKNLTGILNFLKEKWQVLLLMITIPILVFIPQMIYWNHFTGKWIYYSYGNEGFFWSKPAMLQVLFSFRKGWFIYTPLMFFIIPGAIICFKKNRSLFWSILVFFVVNFYLISSWWCWWYGGGFGMRPMIDFYSIFAIFIACFIEYIFKKSKAVFVSVLVVFSFLVYLNLFQTRLARINYIHYDSMTFKAYSKIFLSESTRKKYSDEEWKAFLDTPDYEKAIKGERFW